MNQRSPVGVELRGIMVCGLTTYSTVTALTAFLTTALQTEMRKAERSMAKHKRAFLSISNFF